MGSGLSTESVKLNEAEAEHLKAEQSTMIAIPNSKMRIFSPDNKVQGQGWKTFDVLRQGLTLDLQVINTFYSLFCMADVNNGKGLDLFEFLEFFELPNTRFNRRIFGFFDSDDVEGVDFEEFVCGIWNICSWATEELPSFLFKLYDLDNSKYLELGESVTIVLEVFEHYEDMQEANLLVELLRDYAVPGIYQDDWRLYESNFIEFCMKFEEVWRPLKLMQQLLRAKVLGSEWWLKIGTKSRKVLMASLLEFEKEQFGSSGAEETVEHVYNLQVEEEEREKRRLKWEQGMAYLEQEQVKASEGPSTESEEGTEGTSLLAERLTPLAIVQERNQKKVEDQVNLAQKRIVTMKRFWTAKKEYVEKWNRVAQEMDERSDPITQLFQFENRDMQRDLFITFYNDWEEAQKKLQMLLFPLDKELQKYIDAPGKDDVIWQKKSIRNLPPELQPVVRSPEPENDEDLGSEAGDDSFEEPTEILNGRRSYLQYYGQNHKRVPEEYRSTKLARDLQIVRAKKAGTDTLRHSHTLRQLKSRGVHVGPIAFCCVDML